MTQDLDAVPDGSGRPAPVESRADLDRAAAGTSAVAGSGTDPDRSAATPEPTPPGPLGHPRPGTDSGPPPSGPPDDPDPDGDDPDDWGRQAGWVRPFLIGTAVLGLLLLGAAAGLLIGLPTSNTPIVPTADSVDVGFAQDMSVHHQQAVEMAAWERDHSTDPVLVQLASDIETTQNSQTGRMQGWLDLWGAASLPVGGHMAWMSEPTHDHGAGSSMATMPGMASAADLAALRAATGPDLDVKWLQLMLRHHQGAVGMLQYAVDHAAVPQLRNLATQMLTSQTAETEYLQQLLSQRGGQPLPPP